MGFSRQEYWSELPCPSPGDLPDPGIEHASLASPALASRESLPLASPGKPRLWISVWNKVPDLIRHLVNLRGLKPCSPHWVSGAAEMKKAAVSSRDERSQANLKRHKRYLWYTTDMLEPTGTSSLEPIMHISSQFGVVLLVSCTQLW